MLYLQFAVNVIAKLLFRYDAYPSTTPVVVKGNEKFAFELWCDVLKSRTVEEVDKVCLGRIVTVELG